MRLLRYQTAARRQPSIGPDVLTTRVFVTLLGLYVGSALLLDRHGRRQLSAAHFEAFDAIIVLGCRVYPDGRLSVSLERRVRRAVTLFHEGRAPLLVLTGGVGDAPLSEARAAATLAARLGVPEAALVLEERSTSTEENASEAARLVDASRVLLVTDSYHVFRAERVFARHFSAVRGTGSVGPRSARFKGAMREVAAVCGYALRGRL